MKKKMKKLLGYTSDIAKNIPSIKMAADGEAGQNNIT
jgi:hypothetical protein